MTNHDGDREVLAAMSSHGANLTKPAHIIHYLYFKSLASAQAAANELRTNGFQNLDVHPTPVQSIWKRIFGPRMFTCIAEIHAVPSEANVFAATERMNALAAKLGGEYDGWEASIEK